MLLPPVARKMRSLPNTGCYPTPLFFHFFWLSGRGRSNSNIIPWRVPPHGTPNATTRRQHNAGVLTRMARPHPTLAVADSDRTLVLQRRGRCNNSSKRSAYFADSDSSSVCGEPRPPPREVQSARTTTAAAACTGSSGGSSRSGGRWILEGIRCSQQGQTGESPTIKDEHDRARVFYGSVRFPASRVALW